MNLAALSLVALAIAVTLSCTTKINVGIDGGGRRDRLLYRVGLLWR